MIEKNKKLILILKIGYFTICKKLKLCYNIYVKRFKSLFSKIVDEVNSTDSTQAERTKSLRCDDGARAR